jgi:aspartate kinase
MKVVVQKFGGTCVESEQSQLLSAERIMEAVDQGLQPVVVVSAAGRMGQPYSTAELVAWVTKLGPRISPRELDLLMSCGEIISTVAMAHLLSTRGYDTIALTGGQAGLITDVYHGHARIIRIEKDSILRFLQDKRLVFVTGFQGVSERHAITTLGEGGSDYTAAALAVLLAQGLQLPFGEEIEMTPLQIFKDVDGVMTANPKSFPKGCEPECRHIPWLSYEECEEMSKLGADVFQRKAAAMAREQKVPLMIRNFKYSEIKGTVIGNESAPSEKGKATATPDIANLALFTIRSENPRLSRQVSAYLAKERISHFMLWPTQEEVRFVVKREKYRDVMDLVQRVLFLRGLGAEVKSGGWALVSLVGENLRGDLANWQKNAGGALKKAGLEVFGTICGDLSVSFLVNEAQRLDAVKLLHSRFVL